MTELFFELIKVAIGSSEGLSQLPSNKEWNELYDMAMKQSLVGVCFAALQRLGTDTNDVFARIGMSEMLYLTWMGMAAKIQQKNQIVDEQCVALQKQLSADGLRTSILKGQGVGRLYITTNSSQVQFNLRGLRQSGDIDIWIEGGVKAVVRLAENLGQKADVTEQHVHLDIFENTEVEAHFIPSMLRNPFANAKLQKWFKKMAPLQFANRDENGLCVPTTEFNLVYLLIHIYRHLFAEGVGMRQVMDYYFVLQENRSNETDCKECKERAFQTIQQLGLADFAGALMYAMREMFGLQHEQMLCDPNERYGTFLLNEIMTSGNMGHHDERLKECQKGNRWQRFFMVTKHNMRLMSYYPVETLWAPFTRIKVWAWRKWNGWI